MVARTRRRKSTLIRHLLARYRHARQALHTPASRQSRYGLDWMNFFIADVQTGFGTFVAFYLAHLGWTHGNVGVALTVAGLAGVVSQIPGGALADAVAWKRGLVAVGILMIGVAALILALTPTFLLVLLLEQCSFRASTCRRSSRRLSAQSVSVWSAGAECRCAPAAITATPPAATR